VAARPVRAGLTGPAAARCAGAIRVGPGRESDSDARRGGPGAAPACGRSGEAGRSGHPPSPARAPPRPCGRDRGAVSAEVGRRIRWRAGLAWCAAAARLRAAWPFGLRLGRRGEGPGGKRRGGERGGEGVTSRRRPGRKGGWAEAQRRRAGSRSTAARRPASARPPSGTSGGVPTASRPMARTPVTRLGVASREGQRVGRAATAPHWQRAAPAMARGTLRSSRPGGAGLPVWRTAQADGTRTGLGLRLPAAPRGRGAPRADWACREGALRCEDWGIMMVGPEGGRCAPGGARAQAHLVRGRVVLYK
jgi:hypothetical protein